MGFLFALGLACIVFGILMFVFTEKFGEQATKFHGVLFAVLGIGCLVYYFKEVGFSISVAEILLGIALVTIGICFIAAIVFFVKGDKAKGSIFLAILVAIIVAVCLLTPSKERSNEGYDVLVIAEKEVESKLKSPATAKFSSYNETKITNEGDAWVVEGWVDAQNSFGATLRSEYIVRIVFDGDERYKVEYCIVD
ncbi:MAG: hypothetical protein IJO61_07865 [Oscillospiraceae bacterium]|nr:hypothetical protein [Oscillospiraceae bacterium]